jgi:hopanoid biosynthesis associated RND transporter like protein HpnN
MVKNTIVAVIDFCTRHAYWTIAVAFIVAGVAGTYAARHFAINADVTTLISSKLPWRQQEIAFEKYFPSGYDRILAVVDAPTPELAAIARSDLAQRLAADEQLFASVTQLGATPFFAENGLLFLPTEEVGRVAHELSEAAPLLRVPVSDPSLRGLAQMVAYAVAGVRDQRITLDDTAGPFNAAAGTVEQILAGRTPTFSWRDLINGTPSSASDRRRLLEIVPKLDLTALQPGERANKAIRAAVADLDLASKYQARVRLTGPVAIGDEEYGSLREGALTNGAVTLAVVLFILWLALRSLRIILATVIALFVGLSVTACLGLMMVGALNLISVAFAVLFIGLGVDFGIQFSVRYRQERFKTPDLRAALRDAGARVGTPLTLAAAAVAAGFLSFLPTAYRGVSELGQIAGVGMIVAYVTSITVLPAVLYVLNPPGEADRLGFSAFAPIDVFLEKYRVAVIVGTLGIAIAGLPLLYYMKFDFNPMNLRDPKVESMETYLELRRDPTTGTNDLNVMAGSLAEANAIRDRVKALPNVARAQTIADFIPAEQGEKLAAIAQAATELDPVLAAPQRPAPTDAESIAALNRTIESLAMAAADATGPGADASRRLAGALTALAKADQAVRQRVERIFIVPIKADLDDVRNLLKAQPVTLENLPDQIASAWRSPLGQYRVEILPKGDPEDNENLREFARTVRMAEPTAVGGPISLLESGDAVVRAFIQAGAWALGSISIMLWLTLRRFGDVLLTLVPLMLAGVVTLEICVLVRMPLNFANIIALPLLLGVGVAFKIYYVMAWRAGRTKLMQSSLTRAVIFSAATTATAFGSLWLSNHPGTSSMGKLMALSLVCTLAAAVLFQPALMGKPRSVADA